ncbi:class II aldolase/adducin family protein [Ponticaulis profundi]|uniref:Class II aldolase/adducin family protein n=1 Tax=Ponticaulis profundi TaxID=2665222 RepID=A0ABW1S7Z1_9PROT
MSTEIDLRSELVDIMQRMDDAGLNHGTAGNVSVRFEDGVLISPSGIPASLLRPEQVVFMHLNGDYSGDVKPSSEWRMHTGILEKRPDMQAVVHCHSRFATTLACARKPIPFLHYMTAVSGGAEIPVAPYATFGTQALADEIVQTLDGRFGCLMANHGQIAVSTSLTRALSIAEEIETQAGYYYGTLCIGGPELLTQEDLAGVITQFKSYGQR